MQGCIVLASLCLMILYLRKGQKAENLIKEIGKAREQYHGIAEATVLEVEKEFVMRSMVYYYPTLLYEVDGKAYGESSVLYSTSKQDFVPGKRLQVRYDENKPSEFMLLDDSGILKMAENERSSDRITALACIGFMILGIIAPDFFVR